MCQNSENTQPCDLCGNLTTLMRSNETMPEEGQVCEICSECHQYGAKFHSVEHGIRYYYHEDCDSFSMFDVSKGFVRVDWKGDLLIW